MENQKGLGKRITELELEHRELDTVLDRFGKKTPSNNLELQVKRIKKRKLVIKDEIQKLKSKLIPDTIA
tara:strand:+ start:285 stop:491 length:207 start_codon:yes stop_codon:yes gene_type:complete